MRGDWTCQIFVMERERPGTLIWVARLGRLSRAGPAERAIRRAGRPGAKLAVDARLLTGL